MTKQLVCQVCNCPNLALVYRLRLQVFSRQSGYKLLVKEAASLTAKLGVCTTVYAIATSVHLALCLKTHRAGLHHRDSNLLAMCNQTHPSAEREQNHRR